ncbi:MAG: antitoxin [Verrucomicrobiota bacterium]
MVKTQVQFPDHLYKEAKRIAEEYEMSFAEVVRRGVEEVAKVYPPGSITASEWTLPLAKGMGKPLLPEAEWDTVVRDEA